MSGTLFEEPLRTFSTNNSASLSSAVDSTFYKENCYTDLLPLTLLNSNTIASLMQATDYINLPTTSESSNTSMISESLIQYHTYCTYGTIRYIQFNVLIFKIIIQKIILKMHISIYNRISFLSFFNFITLLPFNKCNNIDYGAHIM